MNTQQTLAVTGLTLFLVLILSKIITPNSPNSKKPVPYNKILHFNGMADLNPPGIIASTDGGLGNQLFKFACAYSLSKKLGVPLYVNLERGNDRAFLLNQFSIPMNQLDNWMKNWSQKVQRISDEDILYNQLTPELISTKLLYHTDYCESELFFREHKDEIKAMYTLEKDPAEQNPWARHWLDLIQNTTINATQNSENNQKYESVAVHIRRGDFENRKSWLTPMRFFRLAMVQMIDKLKREGKIPRFFIFSDSMELVKESLFNLENSMKEELEIETENENKTREMGAQLKNELENDLLKKLDISKDVFYVSESISPEGIGLLVEEEFYLITKCKNMIVSFSTFSWWGAYLIQNENKTIIRPTTNPAFYDHYDTEMRKMFKKVEVGKYWYPNEWMKIDPFFKV